MPEQPSPSPPDSFTAQANQLELEKRRLENEKLRVEIQHESLVWWKRPGYVGGMSPIFLAVIGLFSAWATGFFDTQRANLKSEVKNLQLQQENLRDQNQRLTNATAEIQATIDQAYLSLKLATTDAIYSLSHLRGVGPSLSDDERKTVLAAIQG